MRRIRCRRFAHRGLIWHYATRSWLPIIWCQYYKQLATPAQIDAILPQIQAEREPEIIEIQKLQRAEIAQGELLRNYPPLRYLLSWVVPHIPLLQQRIRQSWIDRQLQLRRGFTQVTLKV